MDISVSLTVQKKKARIKKRSKKSGRGSRRRKVTPFISQEPLEIVSDAPSPLSSSGNAASPEANNGEVDNGIDTDTQNDDDDEGTDTEGDDYPDADQALIFNNEPHPIDYGSSSGYLLFKLREYSDSFCWQWMVQ